MTTTGIAPYSPDFNELAQWVAQQIADGCTRVILRQRAEDGGDSLVREWPLEGDARELAAVVYKRAQEEGRHFRGRILYGAFSYQERDYVDRCFFTVNGGDDEGGHFGQREGASLAGVTSQLMRHNEANARLAVGQTLDVISHYKAMLAARDKRIEELEGKFFEVMAMYEKLNSMQHERELELLKVGRQEKNQDFLREQFGVVAPVVLKKLVGGLGGGKGGDGSAAILGEETLSRFLGSLTEEQQAAILSKLTLQQQIALQEIYVSYGKRKVEQEKQRTEKTKKKSTSGASSDASGGGA